MPALRLSGTVPANSRSKAPVKGGMPWLDTLRADAILGWRQIRKHPATSAAAILSLALALGACVSAFRIIDALLWRPLPVAGAERLFVLVRPARPSVA